MVTRTSRPARRRRPPAHRALALAMAALTGCYTTWSIPVRHDTVEQVERVPAGTHLTLHATEEEPGALAVLAEEQPMCLDQESGTRAWTIRTVSTKGRSGSGGGMGLGGCGGGGGAFALVCLGILVGVLVVLIPVAIIASSLPERTEREEPSGERPQPYRELRGERAACDELAGIASGLPVRLVTRLNQTACLEWSAATAADGTLALLPALDRGRAEVVPCDRPIEPGYLRIEPADQAAPPLGAPEAPLRTHDVLLVPLWQPVADSLGLAAPPVRAGPLSGGQLAAVRACASHLGRDCFNGLVACLAGSRDHCWDEASRCEPGPSRFDACLAGATPD